MLPSFVTWSLSLYIYIYRHARGGLHFWKDYSSPYLVDLALVNVVAGDPFLSLDIGKETTARSRGYERE